MIDLLCVSRDPLILPICSSGNITTPNGAAAVANNARVRALVIFCSAVLFTAAGRAANYTVTTTNASGPNSLRAAIVQANDSPGPHEITFSRGGQFVGDGMIRQSIRLLGFREQQATNNAVAIRGSFTFEGASTILKELNITGSISNRGSLSITGCAIVGGGVKSTGVLQIVSSSIMNSQTAGVVNSGSCTLTDVRVTGCSGGGIRNTGSMIILKSLICSNSHSSFGGAVYSSDEIQIVDCQITDNRTGRGDAGGIFNMGRASVSRTTIRKNVANSGQGGGFSNYGSANRCRS